MSSLVIGVACEDSGHFFAVSRLVDAALLTRHTWLDGIIEDCRRWRGLTDDSLWYKYDPRDANDLRPTVLDGHTFAPSGHIAGVSLKPEAGMWRKVLMLFCRCTPRPDVVVLARDLDGDPRRREGIEQVVSGLRWPFEIAIATAQPEIEAWLVSGFVPADKAEHIRLTQLRKQLSFDPTTQSQRLTSHPTTPPRTPSGCSRSSAGATGRVRSGASTTARCSTSVASPTACATSSTRLTSRSCPPCVEPHARPKFHYPPHP